MKRLCLGFCLLGCITIAVAASKSGASPAESQSAPFTIEQVLSAPFPTELIAAPAKGRFAWGFNAEGKRSVWIAEAASDGRGYTSRPIANYPQDDGQDIGELTWAPDASAVVYVRGGDFDYPGKEYPNPSAMAEGTEQDVWAAFVSGGDPKKIGEGHDPAVSPRDSAVAYVLKGEIWLGSLNGTGKSEQLIHEHGDNGSLRWSPDGGSIAFVSSRGDHSFIGVYSVSAKTVTYLDPSTDDDQEPVWSPDSTKVAFIRIPSQKSTAFERFSQRTGPPWSIRVANVSTGGGREVWRAAAGTGSVFHGVAAHDQLLWCDGDRIVFPWEHDGWTHLYSVPVSGGAAVLMTPGDFEVDRVSLSLDRKTIVFSSNQGDLDRRHVWRVALDGTRPEQVTSGTGIETEPAIASDNQTIAVLRSDARSPMRPAIVEDANKIQDQAADQIPSDFPANSLIAPQAVIFPAADGMQIHGQIFLPQGSNAGDRHAAVVFVHGGSRRQMLLGWNSMSYYSNAYGLNEYLASRGYVVLSVNYRSGTGYGLNFREALNYGPNGASEFNDVLGAGTYLRSRSDVDPKRIGIWGGSYGGYLTALALARASDMFAAGVDFHGVHDWNIGNRIDTAPDDPGAATKAARVAYDSSPMSSVTTWRSPVLLIQGDDDRNVEFSQTVQLAGALRKQGVPYEELVFPDEIHDFLLHKTWIAAYKATADFFNRHLAQ
ncbi:MAG TPA: prolyl oligopeptidase family serine peptidase [Candidatus Acidoferrales bacterium]